MPLEEILTQLARENGRTKEAVQEEMEAYLEELFSGEAAGEEDICQRLVKTWQGRNPDLAEFIARLAQEIEMEKGKEEDLRAYFEG